MTRYLYLFGLFARVSVLNELQYRANFFIQIVTSALGLAVALGGLGVVFSHTDTLKGWTAADLLAILGVYFIVGSAIRTVIQPSMQRLMEDIRTGVLDYAIVKPVETQFLISIRQIEIWKLVDLGIGLALLAIALRQLHVQVTPLNALAFLLLLVCGVLTVYSFWLMLATVTFWFIKIDNILVIFQTMYEAGRWPVRIYPGWLEIVLTFLVPVAFAVTVPVEAITGRMTPATLLIAVGLMAAMLWASHRFWRIGIAAYSGASA
jgi:ABC-2 type transport system permease protein